MRGGAPLGAVRPRSVLLLVGCLLVLLLGACGGDAPSGDGAGSTSTASSSTPPSPSDGPTSAPGPPASVPDPPAALVATAREGSIAVYADAVRPEPDREITGAEVTSAPGIPIVFLVRAEEGGRYEVYLPVRPNGSTGWVDRDDVTVAGVEHRVEVALGEHRLRVLHHEEVIVDEPIGVGRSDRPTPGGVYYLKELLQPPDPEGIYGPYAYGLSGFSNALESFSGGDAVIGIHGTNEPGRIGQDVSSGCIRVHNDVIRRLVEEVGLPLGTPVAILP